MIERNVTSAALERYFDEIYDLLENSSNLLLSDKKIIDTDALCSILDELRSRIPKEVIRAEKTEETRDNIIKDAYQEADRIVQQANAEAERIVALANEHAEKTVANAEEEAARLIKQEEIFKEANAIAEEIKANALRYQEDVKAEANSYEAAVKAEADEFATATKLEALQYVDNMLEFFESNFNENLKTMATNRDAVLFELQKINAHLPKTTRVVVEETEE